MDPSIEDIRSILRIFLDSELEELRLEVGNVRLAVTRSGAGNLSIQPFSSPAPAAASAPGQTPAADSAPAVGEPSAATPSAQETTAPTPAPTAGREGLVAVTAPSVGVFYRRPSPDQPAYVEVGSTVSEKDTVCLVEVMKLFTGVTAPCKGRIAEILVEDSAMVEYGQPLMYIDPD